MKIGVLIFETPEKRDWKSKTQSAKVTEILFSDLDTVYSFIRESKFEFAKLGDRAIDGLIVLMSEPLFSALLKYNEITFYSGGFYKPYTIKNGKYYVFGVEIIPLAPNLGEVSVYNPKQVGMKSNHIIKKDFDYIFKSQIE